MKSFSKRIFENKLLGTGSDLTGNRVPKLVQKTLPWNLYTYRGIGFCVLFLKFWVITFTRNRVLPGSEPVPSEPVQFVFCFLNIIQMIFFHNCIASFHIKWHEWRGICDIINSAYFLNSNNLLHLTIFIIQIFIILQTFKCSYKS